MRKARAASFSAWICPVRTTVSPTLLCSTVTVRTGRGSGALASVSSLHPASGRANAGSSSNAQAIMRRRAEELLNGAIARSSIPKAGAG